MDKPKPVALVVKKGSKMRVRTVSGIPKPFSAIAIYDQVFREMG
jgi:hypothetical protein